MISRIEAANSKQELQQTLQDYVESLGFHSFSFIENELSGHSDPLIVNSIPEAWEEDYRRNDFISVDPCLPVAQRRNTPFTWGMVPLPQQQGVRKPRAHRLMEAARDHGFQEGLVVPFHFRDRMGVFHSSVCTLFWTRGVREFLKRLALNRAELHLVLIYWAERTIALAEAEVRARNQDAINGTVHLTDRERDVLSWAANGKTTEETALILGISPDTATGYIKSAMRKLDAVSKTQAVVRAITEGLIRV